MKSMNPYHPNNLVIKTTTWGRDSHGLFDYESKNIQKKLIQAVRSVYLERVGNEIRQTNSLADLQVISDAERLCKIEVSNSEFSIESFEDHIWKVVKTMKNKHGSGFIAKEGDVIKIGRICFRISLCRGECESEENTQDSEEFDTEIPNEREMQTCRICLTSDFEEGNPLISPCKCAGSMKFIHLLCLRHWIDSRMVSRSTENCFVQSWKSIDCEICKSSLRLTIEGIGKSSEYLKISKPKAPFILLEGIGNDKNSHKGVYLASIIGNGGICIGRGHDADIRVADISVSRSHARIMYVDGTFIIEDNNSKFGTLLKLDKKLVMKKSTPCAIQIGRTFISISTKPQLN